MGQNSGRPSSIRIIQHPGIGTWRTPHVQGRFNEDRNVSVEEDARDSTGLATFNIKMMIHRIDDVRRQLMTGFWVHRKEFTRSYGTPALRSARVATVACTSQRCRAPINCKVTGYSRHVRANLPGRPHSPPGRKDATRSRSTGFCRHLGASVRRHRSTFGSCRPMIGTAGPTLVAKARFRIVSFQGGSSSKRLKSTSSLATGREEPPYRFSTIRGTPPPVSVSPINK